jgi:hypothetical protein
MAREGDWSLNGREDAVDHLPARGKSTQIHDGHLGLVGQVPDLVGPTPLVGEQTWQQEKALLHP